MSIISKVCICVALVSFLILLASFVINNYKVLNVTSVALLIAVMFASLTGICVDTNRTVSVTAQEYRDSGFSSGYERGYSEAMYSARKQTQVSNISYESIQLTFPDGNTETYEFSLIPDTNTVEGFGSVKTYEDYRCITSATASQTKLNNLDCVYTDSNGFRKINDYYLVALGSFYGSIGDIYHIELSNGRHFLAIKGDAKADKDTDSEHKYQKYDGSVIEFIVDSDILIANGCQGNCSIFGFEGPIVNMELVGHYNF